MSDVAMQQVPSGELELIELKQRPDGRWELAVGLAGLRVATARTDGKYWNWVFSVSGGEYETRVDDEAAARLTSLLLEGEA